MIDIFYILGNGSPFNNEELRYSLRSVERHLKNIGRIIVVGENPNFLSDEVEYHYIKEAKCNKECRILKKIFTACELGIVKGDFLFMNDDFFFTKDVDATTYPYYYSKCLSEGSPNKFYSKNIESTHNYLKGLGCTAMNFDVHTPIIYNSEKFLELQPHIIHSKRNPWGFVVKSMYSNIHGIVGELYEDVKINRINDYTLARIEKTNCVSYSDVGYKRGVKEYLMELFPEKSKYEE